MDTRTYTRKEEGKRSKIKKKKRAKYDLYLTLSSLLSAVVRLCLLLPVPRLDLALVCSRYDSTVHSLLLFSPLLFCVFRFPEAGKQASSPTIRPLFFFLVFDFETKVKRPSAEKERKNGRRKEETQQ